MLWLVGGLGRSRGRMSAGLGRRGHSPHGRWLGDCQSQDDLGSLHGQSHPRWRLRDLARRLEGERLLLQAGGGLSSSSLFTSHIAHLDWSLVTVVRLYEGCLTVSQSRHLLRLDGGECIAQQF